MVHFEPKELYVSKRYDSRNYLRFSFRNVVRKDLIPNQRDSKILRICPFKNKSINLYFTGKCLLASILEVGIFLSEFFNPKKSGHKFIAVLTYETASFRKLVFNCTAKTINQPDVTEYSHSYRHFFWAISTYFISHFMEKNGGT